MGAGGGTEVREAGIRLVLKLSLQIMCSSAHPRHARFCSGPTHTNTLLRPACTLAPLLAQNGSHSLCDDENESYSSGGLDLNMAEKLWRRCRAIHRSLAGAGAWPRFSSYKAHCGPGLEGGLGKCERW